MHIITTIYFADVRDLDDTKDAPLEASDLKDADRQWLSIYEGKNRVEPIDEDR
jgi:hypothetical protein